MIFSLINHHDFKSLERIFVVIFESNDPKQGNEQKKLSQAYPNLQLPIGADKSDKRDNLLKHYRNEWVHNAFMAFRGTNNPDPLETNGHTRESQMDHQGSRTKKKNYTTLNNNLHAQKLQQKVLRADTKKMK